MTDSKGHELRWRKEMRLQEWKEGRDPLLLTCVVVVVIRGGIRRVIH